MFKKLDKYLLENHPVVWNTKWLWMLLLLVVYNVIFFLFGFFSYQNPVELQETMIFQRFFTSVYVWFGVLSAILILVVWLNQYFKQNAFKSLYPKSNLSLYKEFLIIFSILFLLTGTYVSFNKGLETRIANVKTKTEIKEYKDLINRVAPFTLQLYFADNDQNSNSYAQSSRCLPLPLFDSLVNEDRLLKKFVANQVRNNTFWEKVDTANYKIYKDSLDNQINQNLEFDLLLLEHFPSRKNWTPTHDYKTSEPVVYQSNSTYEAAVEITEYTENYPSDSSYQSVRYNLKSIYNYCNELFYDFDSIRNPKYYAEQTHKLLLNNQKDSIQKLMDRYLKLADELNVGYRFKDKDWIDYVYNPPYYFVDYELQESTRYNRADNKTYYKDYIYEAGLTTSINNIYHAQKGIIKLHEIITWLYVSLFFTLLIFTFRMTSMRSWVVSLVGSIIVFFVYLSTFFIFLQAMIFYELNLGLGLLLAFFALFWIITGIGISQSKWKLATGVNLNWVVWTFGAILPIAISLYSNWMDNLYPPTYVHDGLTNQYIQHPHVEWISDNFTLIAFTNLLVVFIGIYFLISVFKKWQAMADE